MMSAQSRISRSKSIQSVQKIACIQDHHHCYHNPLQFERQCHFLSSYNNIIFLTNTFNLIFYCWPITKYTTAIAITTLCSLNDIFLLAIATICTTYQNYYQRHLVIDIVYPVEGHQHMQWGNYHTLSCIACQDIMLWEGCWPINKV